MLCLLPSLLLFEFLDDFLQGHGAIQDRVAGVVAADELSVDPFVVRWNTSDHHVRAALGALLTFVIVEKSP